MRSITRWCWRRPGAASRGLGGGHVVAASALAALLLALGSSPTLAQQGSVGGTVLSEQSMRPLSGAQVVVEGTNRGTLTDPRGRFLITGLTGSEVTLRVVMLGHRPVTRSVRVGETDVRISLAETAIELDQVVVTGTPGGQQKREIGNSVAQIRAADLVEVAPIQNMQQMLNGRAAGVFVAPSSGQVGGGQRIRIRGMSTFSLSAEPLLYVDGVRVNNEASTGISVQGFGSGAVSRLGDFNPEDIESIEIIKGPAAATLYGTEAARGVINIITKKGRAAETRYNFTLRNGASWFHDAENRLPTNFWRDRSGTVQSLNVYARELAAGRPLFRTGHQQGYNASVSGGSQAVRFFVSGDVDRDQGIDPSNAQQRFSGRVNLQANPSERVELNVNAGYVNSDTDLACEAGCGGRMWAVLFASPQLLPENCAPNAPYGCGFTRGFRSWAPEGYGARDISQGIHRFTGSVAASWKPFPWMTHRLTVGRDLTNEDNVEFLPFLTNDTLRFFWGPRWANGYRFQNLREVIQDTYDYSGSVNLPLREGLSSTTSFGVQYFVKDVELASVQGEGFPAPGVTTVAAAALKTFQTQDYFDNRTLGVFGQQTFGWQDRLFVTGALRVDNNSAFGSEVDFVAYPKASVSWVLNEEPFFEGIRPSFLSTLRLRAAYGESGQQPEIFSALRTFSPVPGPGGSAAVTPQAVGNPELKPERGREVELGFDAGLLNERLGLDVTFYRTRIHDAILLQQVAPSTGFPGSRYVNAGEILNQGVEGMLRAQLINQARFGWDVQLNLATNKGRVERLAGDDTTIVVGSTQHRIGYPVGSWFRERVVSAELNDKGRAVNVMCDDGKGGSTPCFNAAGQVVAPRVYLGRTTPSAEGAVSTTFRFLENIQLYAMLDYKAGFKKWDNNLRARCQVFSLCAENMEPHKYDPRVVAQMQTSGTLVDFVINDASFARLREISLDLGIPAALAERIGARNASLNVAARNLGLWTNYTGLDPEAMFLGGSVAFQFEQDQIPHPRQFVTTLKVGF